MTFGKKMKKSKLLLLPLLLCSLVAVGVAEEEEEEEEEEAESLLRYDGEVNIGEQDEVARAASPQKERDFNEV